MNFDQHQKLGGLLSPSEERVTDSSGRCKLGAKNKRSTHIQLNNYTTKLDVDNVEKINEELEDEPDESPAKLKDRSSPSVLKTDKTEDSLSLVNSNILTESRNSPSRL